jgi:hypothetical protein
MAFLKSSRYFGLPTVTVEVAGRRVTAVTLRRLAEPASKPYVVESHDRLDVIAQRDYQDGTRFWAIADANTELEAEQLTAQPGRVIETPK